MHACLAETPGPSVMLHCVGLLFQKLTHFHITLPLTERVKDTANAADNWLELARKSGQVDFDDVRIGFSSAGVEKPLYTDVSALADAAADLPITSPLTEGIMDIVNAADDWLELARKTVAKRNSGQKLGKCLQWMLCSLDRALEQFTLRLQVNV